MREYQSHKIVKAAQVVSVRQHLVANWKVNGISLTYDDGPGEALHPANDRLFAARGIPSIGDYIVSMPDGEVFFMPRAEFEESFHLVEQVLDAQTISDLEADAKGPEPAFTPRFPAGKEGKFPDDMSLADRIAIAEKRLSGLSEEDARARYGDEVVNALFEKGWNLVGCCWFAPPKTMGEAQMMQDMAKLDAKKRLKFEADEGFKKGDGAPLVSTSRGVMSMQAYHDMLAEEPPAGTFGGPAIYGVKIEQDNRPLVQKLKPETLDRLRQETLKRRSQIGMQQRSV